jgi:hypothetical protein
VKKLGSWLEDTRRVLEIIQEENERGPQPPGTIPVTLDSIGMYTNVPLEEVLSSFKAAMNMREDQTIPTEFLVFCRGSEEGLLAFITISMQVILSKCPLTHCLPYRLSLSGRPSELCIKQIGTI